MKKHLLALIAFITMVALPAQAFAAKNTDATVTIRANGSVCEHAGTISPDTISARHGDTVLITFKNAERQTVEIHNLPGGTLTVPGNGKAERTFKASSSFTYSAWSVEGNCEKATARVSVSGGWWERAWPWGLAILGSIIVIWLVSQAGRGKLGPPTNPEQ